MSRFLCIDPKHEGGRAQPWYLREMGYTGVRFVAFPDRFDDVAMYLNEGFLVQLVIARESGPVEAFADWFATDDEGLAQWFRSVVYWVVGNEPDGHGESSWVMNPYEYAELWQRSRVLHGERWVAGQCSGWLDRSQWYMQEDMAGVVIHPYGKDPWQAVELCKEYANRFQTQVWVGEFFPVTPYNSADYFYAFAMSDGYWANRFCYSDHMVSGFGLESVA